MKVVLFCGGLGMRLREYSETVPKPMVQIGYRPILWHVMKYYAHYGHKDFILCLGWKADVIKRYFLEYDECVSNDFVLSGGGQSVDLINRDIQDWNITFVDTGTSSNIGERLMAVRPFLEGEETFLANYADGLSDFPLPKLIDFHRDTESVASFLAVKPMQSFHSVTTTESGHVQKIEAVTESDTWINAGFFVLNNQIFDYMNDGDELVIEPFQRLIEKDRLTAYRYPGFFACMDTFKEKQTLDDMYSRGDTPWEVWNKKRKQAATDPDLRLLNEVNSLSNELQQAGKPDVKSGIATASHSSSTGIGY
ncbi:glucose-1-phosphate cytidylyltransferase [Rubinisphaera margarita]|uniref:glucose-1-phosphate cytidylyltransferase n=1 Tax=Rubinisphaera margarita TaxID=2909586 RepID=UPI001EE7DC1A|nr:glucose-1-phosphate cytidylyltransferase [Rubinisphaera margarita]MCG6155283.1 glucose-1-phosphate cytidylyltransferase [Rubinisphaera margarita]